MTAKMKVWCEPREYGKKWQKMAITVCIGYFGHNYSLAKRIADEIDGKVRTENDPAGHWDYIVTKSLTFHK